MARRLIATLNDTTLFLQELLQNPLRTGAVAPSSRILAKAMARWVVPETGHFVLELGPGTGAVTQALLHRGVAEDQIVAIEKNPKMVQVLRDRFPGAHIITGDALRFDSLLKRHFGEVNCVQAVVSSLPLRNFLPHEAENLAKKIRAVLRPGGKWIQYSYNLGNTHPKGANCFQLITSDVVWFNLPPARLNVYQKQVA